MKRQLVVSVLLAAPPLALPGAARAADYHHVHVLSPNASEAARWYVEHLDCEPIPGRDNACRYGSVILAFLSRPAMGGSVGTGVNHIGLSYADLTAKMAELEQVGVGGLGVRLQRFDDGATIRDVPGLFKIAFVFDPWGTRIELVEDPEYLGFHHIHLSSTDPASALDWYEKMFGGERASLKGRLNGLLYDTLWLLVSEQENPPAATEGRAIDHLGWAFPDIEAAMRELGEKGAEIQGEIREGRTVAKYGFVISPEKVRVEVVQP